MNAYVSKLVTKKQKIKHQDQTFPIPIKLNWNNKNHAYIEEIIL